METKNISAQCLEPNNSSEYVEHRVMYEQLVDNQWLPKTITLMAIDPLHAINIFRGV